jgi:hypothetical protein
MKTLMNEFGAYLGPDQQEIPFELDILIDEIDLKA